MAATVHKGQGWDRVGVGLVMAGLGVPSIKLTW